MLSNLNKNTHYELLKNDAVSHVNYVKKNVNQYSEKIDDKTQLEEEYKKKSDFITNHPYTHAENSITNFITVCAVVDNFVQQIVKAIQKAYEAILNAENYLNFSKESTHKKQNYVTHYTNAIEKLNKAVNICKKLKAISGIPDILSTVNNAQLELFKSVFFIKDIIDQYNEQVQFNKVLLYAYKSFDTRSINAVIDALITNSSALKFAEHLTNIDSILNGVKVNMFKYRAMNYVSDYIPKLLRLSKTVQHSEENASECIRNARRIIDSLLNLMVMAQNVKSDASSTKEKVVLVKNNVTKAIYFNILITAEIKKADIDTSITSVETAMVNFKAAVESFNASKRVKDTNQSIMNSAFNNIEQLKFYMDKGSEGIRELNNLAMLEAKTKSDKDMVVTDMSKINTFNMDASKVNRKYDQASAYKSENFDPIDLE